MANSKMTKRDWFNVIDGIVAESGDARTAEIQAFIAHEIELLNRKGSTSKPTKTQEANVALCNQIVAIMREIDKPVTVTDLMAVDGLIGYSNQKLTAMMTKLRNSGEVVSVKDKKRTLFSLAD